MKFYKIIFTDYSETIGTAANKSAMKKDANYYCRAWNLEERPKDIIEISEAEYNSLKR